MFFFPRTVPVISGMLLSIFLMEADAQEASTPESIVADPLPITSNNSKGASEATQASASQPQVEEGSVETVKTGQTLPLETCSVTTELGAQIELEGEACAEVAKQKERSSTPDVNQVIAEVVAQVTRSVSEELAGEIRRQVRTEIAASIQGEPAPLSQSDWMIFANRRSQSHVTPIDPKLAGEVRMTYGLGIPTVVCTIVHACRIELEAGEHLEDAFVVADIARWHVEWRTSPTRDQTSVFVKPNHDATKTTLNIVTDRRYYDIILVPHSSEYTTALTFNYPDTIKRQQNAKLEAERQKRETAAAAAAARKAANLVHSGKPTANGLVSADALDHNFKVLGKAPWKPVSVYADKRRMYILMPKSHRHGDMPAVLTSQASNVKVTVSQKNPDLLIVDRILAQFRLRVGKKEVRVVRDG